VLCHAVLQVCFACVEEGEFKLAQLCGLNIIVNADDLDEVSEFYQRRGHFDQLMSLMESGLVSEASDALGNTQCWSIGLQQRLSTGGGSFV
jgi:hypothetical protein